MNMSSYTHLHPHFLVIDIEKPLFTLSSVDTVRISKKYVDQAIHNFIPLVVRTPNGERVFYPKSIKKDGKKVKETFLYPDNPMVMYELEIPHSPKREEEYYQFS